MKKYMPLEGLRWSRDSGSTLCDTPQNGRSRTGWGGKYFFTHEYFFFPASTIMKIKGKIIKSLIQTAVIYYRYCLHCISDFPMNK